MNIGLLEKYQAIEIPRTCLYRKEPDAEEMFREYDSPLAFLDLEEYQQLALYRWCRSLEKVQKINKRHSSYGLKHIFAKDNKGFYI